MGILPGHPDSDAADSELLQLLHGNEQAWGSFVKRHTPLIWKTIFITLRRYNFRYGTTDAEEIYAALFLALVENDFRKLRSFLGNGSSGLATWLCVVTTRMTIDFIRKELSRARELHDSDVLHAISDERPGPGTSYEANLREAAVHEALKKLDPADARLYRCLIEEQLSPEKTAAELECSVQAVYTRKNRMIEKIKKMLADV